MVVRNTNAQATRVRDGGSDRPGGGLVTTTTSMDDATVKLTKKATASLRVSPQKSLSESRSSDQATRPAPLPSHSQPHSKQPKKLKPISAKSPLTEASASDHLLVIAAASPVFPPQPPQTTQPTAQGTADSAASASSAAPFVNIAPATSGAATPPEAMGLKLRKPDAPKFLLMLYEILQNESDKVIRWTDDGLALQILEQTNVTEKVLPKYFNHTNFHSFQRQLNYFGFRKWTKSKTDICTFSHPYFRRNQPELMHLIKRKKATRRVNATEQAEMYYPTEKIIAAAAQLKKLLPSSPTSKRKYAQESQDEDEQQQQKQQQYAETSENGGSFNGASPNSGALPILASGVHMNSTIMLAPLNPQREGAQGSSTGQPILPSAASLTNAISPASGGAKKKSKTSSSSGNKSGTPDSAGPSQASKTSSSAIPAIGAPQGNFGNGSLPNLDMVRNRYYQQQPTGVPGPMPGFGNGYGPPPSISIQQPSSLSDSASQSNRTPSLPTPPSNGDSSSQFTNSFSDPVDILLRIKKSRAMSQDNTMIQSPQQRSQGQADSFASLQNYFLSQSLYTNRLESQLKLALDENEALRALAEAKQREVETLLNERKMIQNENSVLTEDKNKLFEINRDLLSKLFPQ